MSDLIDRQAAIDALDSINCFGWVEGSWKTVCGIIEHVPSAQPESRWIPVTERLPDKIGEYFVTALIMKKYRIIKICSYGERPSLAGSENSKMCFYESDNDYEDFEIIDVLAWMPSPGPYREETEDE